MKKSTLFFTLLIGLVIISCNSKPQKKEVIEEIKQELSYSNYNAFGGKVTADQILDSETISQKYSSMKEGDTIDIAFSGLIDDVCKAKGCWMKVKIGDQKETMVKFKDYAFFVPTDTGKDSVVVQGKAYVSETSVDELRHLASDAGKSEEEIAAITIPKKTLSFMADGVLIKK